MKKNYNPFKMWGSYVGALIGLISSIVFYQIYTGEILDGVLNFVGNNTSLCNFWSSYLYVSSFIFVSFLLGWGIHSLVRYLKK